MKKKLCIISLGGSLLAPSAPNIKFIKDLQQVLKKRVQKGDRFILVCGGGGIGRQYQEGLRGLGVKEGVVLDWQGIFATQCNAWFLVNAFGKMAHPEVLTNPHKQERIIAPIAVASGFEPGRSSDDVAVRLAKTYGVNEMINLTSISHVYTKDPRKVKSAKPILELSWKEYRKMFGNVWRSTDHTPFDPIAAKSAEGGGIKVLILSGKNMKPLMNYLEKGEVIGTVVDVRVNPK